MANYQVSHGKSTVNYDSETGLFTWILAYRKPSFTGANVGQAWSNGYLGVKIGGRVLSAARLAWQLVNGPIPDGLEIDHINRVRTDNRISNLRLVTRVENLENRTFPPNTLGVFGVSMHKKTGLFRARFKGKTRYFETLGAAAVGYQEMARLGEKSQGL